jgi:hypothetical protein
MNRSAVVWTIVLVIAGGWLVYRATSSEMAKAYVQEIPPEAKRTWSKYQVVDQALRTEPNVSFSLSHTVGVWISALLTLCIFSFLWGDNFFYKFAEALFVGVSAAYLMAVGFWTGIVQNLLGKLIPDVMRNDLGWLPGLPESQEPDYLYLVPLALSFLMLMRLSPKGGWISRWPLAFFIGATAGVRLLGYFESDFVRQIQNTLLPLIVMHADGTFNFWASLQNATIVVGVLATLVYFFFSVEHTGVVGKVSRLGIVFLMITFGASFGYTVMGRIALLAQRLEFLFDDWLWLIDPLGKRIGL